MSYKTIKIGIMVLKIVSKIIFSKGEYYLVFKNEDIYKSSLKPQV